MKKQTLFIIAVLAAFAISLIPSIKRTILWSSNYYDLVILATMGENSVSYNPYAKDFFWIRSGHALWILKNCDYPYESCPKKSASGVGCNEPKISWAGRSLGSLDAESEKRVYELLSHIIKRGEPLNALTPLGFTAFHEAVLYKQKKYVELLITAGADPLVKATNDGPTSGKNVFEFADWLAGEKPDKYTEIAAIVKRLETENVLSHLRGKTRQ